VKFLDAGIVKCYQNEKIISQKRKKMENDVQQRKHEFDSAGVKIEESDIEVKKI
jgi:hypothetical protein